MAAPGTGISAEVAIPYVEIVNCCDSSDRGLYNIGNFDPNTFQDGIYVITGPGFVTSQMAFYPGRCYLITYPGNAGTPYQPISVAQFAQFTLDSTDIENGCAGCIDCNPSLSKLIFTSCCNQSVIETQGPLPSVFTGPGGLINYTGAPSNGFENFCYTVSVVTDISPEEYNILPLIPLSSQYTVVAVEPTKCDDFRIECPTCEDPQCYTLVNCDGISFTTWFDLSDYVGQYIEIEEQAGTWFVIENNGRCDNAIITVTVLDTVDPCPCLCYEITGTLKSLQYVNCDNEVVKDATITKFCSRIYPIYSGTPGQFQITQGEECIDGLCPAVCYKLTNCDTNEIIYSTLQTLSQYVNTSSVVTLLGYEGCWSVTENAGVGCDCLTVTLEDRSGVYEYQANTIGTLNGYNVYQYTDGVDQYYIWYEGVWLITQNQYGNVFAPLIADSKFQGSCPELISEGTFDGWVIRNGAYINLQTEICPSPCDCPVDVTVLQEFDTCGDCEPTIAYKLQNCEKIYEVQYTTQDLSAYVNQVIEDDCGCWTVQQINYVPPSTTLITIDNSFKTCNDCLSTFYRLTDCTGEVEDIVTKTNLKSYLGKVIKIENCDVCWEVTETREFTELSNVVVVQNFETCEDCGVPTVCECTKVTNLNQTKKTYTYYDCDNVLQSITLEPGESSDKVCVLYWVTEPLFCSCIKFEIKGQSYYAFIVPGELFNGKPFYTLCEIDDITTCGYVYWDGSNWVISDSDDNLTWILPTSTSESCPYGDWEEYNQEVGPNPIGEKTKAAAVSDLTSQPCDLDICTCITFTTNLGDTTTLYVIAIDGNGYPIYSDGVFTIQFSLKSFCWVYGLNEFRDPYLLCDGDADCPIGNWETESGQVISAVSIECPPVSIDFTVFDHFETFGECKFGNCPQPVFKNNRSVRPGYNTPICSPEKYDKITCKFADIMYKLALEQRYGITNCCPEEDDKWLIQKELIDLQALKDPNYICQECSGSCNNNSCHTCNCKN
jgi:hypothetical protein